LSDPNDKSENDIHPLEGKKLDVESFLNQPLQAADTNPNHRSGFVAIVGRPNVGKSTLMNYLLGEKLSITSDKPQTTRHSILGICTKGDYQAVFVDTPGLHGKEPRSLNRYMNRAARASAAEADFAILVIEAMKFTGGDRKALQTVAQSGIPFGLVINKVDQVTDRKKLLPWLQSEIQGLEQDFEFIVPVSAQKGDNLDALWGEIGQRLALQPWIFPAEQITDKSERFIAAEIIREKLIRTLHQELPYSTTVEIDFFREEEKATHIGATIYVERAGQKGIVIGKQGKVLKAVGEKSRIEIERMLGRKVWLETWVKVRDNWTDNERALRDFGFE
jgi:GTP-binding protein Era